MSHKIKKITDNIRSLSKSIENNFDKDEIERIYSDYDDICLDIIADESIPKDISDYILKDLTNIQLPQKYLILSEMYEFKERITKILRNKISDAVKTGSFSEIADYLMFALRVDIKNVELYDYVADLYKENELYKELIEVYRTAFIFTTNPDYFTKIGDVQILMKNYDSAIDSYLSYAEIKGPTAEIYKKLAELFDKINDNESKLACIEQMKSLEVSNAE